MPHATTAIKISVNGVLQLLDRALADEFMLYVKTRNYHWNVEGSGFRELHKLFEEQYEALSDAVDTVAEHKRALGSYALGTTSEMAGRSGLREYPGKVPTDAQMLDNLAADHEAVVGSLRQAAEQCEKFRDLSTMDLFIELIRKHQKMAWMLKASVPKGKEMQAGVSSA